jgi:hypothetical protein
MSAIPLLNIVLWLFLNKINEQIFIPLNAIIINLGFNKYLSIQKEVKYTCAKKVKMRKYQLDFEWSFHINSSILKIFSILAIPERLPIV